MIFSAKIVLGSHTWNLWREQGFKGGVLEGVWFNWYPDESRYGGSYVSDELADMQIIAMRDNPDAMLEVRGAFAPPEALDEDFSDTAETEQATVSPPVEVQALKPAPEPPSQMPRFVSREQLRPPGKK